MDEDMQKLAQKKCHFGHSFPDISSLSVVDKCPIDDLRKHYRKLLEKGDPYTMPPKRVIRGGFAL